MVCLKAYGDFVIAHSAAQLASNYGADVRLLIGHHLEPLYRSLNSTVPALVLDHNSSGVPPLYDLRRSSWRQVVTSGWSIRRSLRAVAGEPLTFDRISVRERLIGYQHRISALPPAPNIYSAYHAYFDVQGLTVNRSGNRNLNRRVAVFPTSRIRNKCLPDQVLQAVSNCMPPHLQAVLYHLEGEEQVRCPSGMTKIQLPRDFSALRDAILDSGTVISADSLPAHLAEHLGRRVFVLSPVANTYWFPLSCLSDARWSLFDDVKNGALGKFLEHDAPQPI